MNFEELMRSLWNTDIYCEAFTMIEENSRIFKKEEFYSDLPQNGFSPRAGGGYIYFSEGYSLHKCQTTVTYTCKKGQWNGYVPEFKGKLLPRTMEALKNKKPLSTVLFGDSISEGWNSSGKTVCEPYLPV